MAFFLTWWLYKLVEASDTLTPLGWRAESASCMLGTVTNSAPFFLTFCWMHSHALKEIKTGKSRRGLTLCLAFHGFGNELLLECDLSVSVTVPFHIVCGNGVTWATYWAWTSWQNASSSTGKGLTVQCNHLRRFIMFLALMLLTLNTH